MYPLVSVIIPVYNREGTIMRALDSVLAQTYSNIEVIVVDDGSTDSTVWIVGECKDPRVRLVCLNTNCGANAARNRGIELAEGEFVAFQDSDDEWMKNKLEKQVGYMLESGVSASYCPYISHKNGQCHIPLCDYSDMDRYGSGIKKILTVNNVVGTPTLVIRKEVFYAIGLFDESMERLQDYEFVIRIVKNFRLGYIPEPLVNVYVMDESISTNNRVLADTYLKLLERHMDFLNLEKFLQGYFENLDLYGKLEWKDIERIAAVVRGYEGGRLEKEFCWITMRYLHGQFQPVKETIWNWYSFYELRIRTREFAIYGAGRYGRKAYGELKEKGYIPKCFLITERGVADDIEGVPIVPIAECDDYKMPVIIAVAWETQKELVSNLLQKGMDRFCIYPFCS